VTTLGDVGRLLDQSGGVHNRTDSPMCGRRTMIESIDG